MVESRVPSRVWVPSFRITSKFCRVVASNTCIGGGGCSSSGGGGGSSGVSSSSSSSGGVIIPEVCMYVCVGVCDTQTHWSLGSWFTIGCGIMLYLKFFISLDY